MICCMVSYSLFLVYFLVYRFINLRIIIILGNFNLKSLSILRSKRVSISFFLVLAFMFISLAGLPPFLGFYPKIIVVYMGMSDGYYVFLLMLVLGSLINIFYYLNIFFSLYLYSYFGELKLLSYLYSKFFVFITLFFALISVLGLGLFYFFIIYAMILFYKSQGYWYFIYNFWYLVWSFGYFYEYINSC